MAALIQYAAGDVAKLSLKHGTLGRIELEELGMVRERDDSQYTSMGLSEGGHGDGAASFGQPNLAADGTREL
ncbi:hypothetical protein CVT26_015440 [Gymnopilus dilepis]|uniref:Uncharacterized protein n=1 Tax=Gymnopilus dilepis TaxID=231916 RepID=A0A409YEK1_9AGAR|nr:hypothetical protein CVT26_015440 [Gymnopilus dilepis]